MLLPIGYDDFRKIIENKLDFVDKSLFIKEVLDDRVTEVAVITRPRRFGKTTNLSMLRYFLAPEAQGLSTEGLFNHLKITECGPEYMQHNRKYPVIFVTFKEIKKNKFESAITHVKILMSQLFTEHQYLLASTKLSQQQKNDFNAVIARSTDPELLSYALKDLTHYLYLEHGIKPWLLIDEYDTPLQEAYANDYFDKMIDFMRGLLGAALKSNPYLHRAVITGILRVSKESLFSDLNNLNVYSLLRPEYSQHFGFTESEVNEILKQSNLENKAEEIKRWYNGYQAGNTVVYNPWSITNCVKQKGLIQPYWVNTSANHLIKNLLKKSSVEFKAAFSQLMDGQTIRCLIDEGLVFYYLNHNSTAVWSLLFAAGYLKVLSSQVTSQGLACEVTIPNREVNNLYRQIIEQWLSNGHGIEWYNAFIESLLTGNVAAFKSHLRQVLLQIASYHDLANEPEAFFHGLLLGFSASLHGGGNYEIKSNRESALGRFDILIIPKDVSRLGIIIELKNSKDEKYSLEQLAQEAMAQIEANQYAEEFKVRGIANTVKYAIGFHGKACEVISKKS